MPIQSDFVSVPEAAQRLGVHPSRVRAMVRAGQLEAEKVAGRWLIHRTSLDRRQDADIVEGRPYSAPNAWALLCLSEGRPVHWIDPSALSRLRAKLRSHGLLALAPRLRTRAQRLSFRAHPSALERLPREPGVVKSGVSAASEAGMDIQADDELEAYVSASQVDALVSRYHLEPSERPNLVLHVVADDLPFAWEHCVGRACIAIDLLESDDPRSRRAAKELLERLDFPSGTS